ncbi:unnamed protein product [Mytilus coruscus]|uniref:AIG1-type G domain-containing protein n=1 Tax=Mytilus coruscus TaxID=42192 RepID=A0A6J8EQS7_MYTCO|nr:unnamed protein product [Mytilus coruscus]
MKVNCRVNIIDTPGFNDTRNTTEEDEKSKNFDKRIEMQIKHLFESIVDHLDAILIVVPLGETRLTGAQKHIFSSIVKLFGSDVKQNIFIAMTKDDGGAPDCLNVIKAAGIPYAECFRFNNSNVFTKESPETDAIIWSKRKEAFTLLFKYLETAPKTSVKSSVDVMNARFVLQLQLEALKDTLSELTQEVANANINTEEVIERDLIVSEYERQYTGKSCMNCTVFLTSSGCSVCDNKCNSDKHIREKYKYELKFVKKTFSDESSVKPLKESFVQFQTTIAKIEELIKELKEKALKDCVLRTELYIQELINRENKECQEGYQLRVNVLGKVILHLKTGESIWKLRADSLTN